MPSYLITGVSRGIGYEFLHQYSSDTKNVVIGLVRDKPATEKKISEDADLKGRSNIHIISADLTNYAQLQNAVSEVSKITGGSLDYLIANAALIIPFDQYNAIGELGDKPEELANVLRELFEINVIATIHLFNLFLPLIQKGETKKIIALTTGYADADLTRTWDFYLAPLYSTSKAALNMVVAKFSAQYKKDGILFMGLSPGMVDTGMHESTATPEQLAVFGAQFGRVLPLYAPFAKGMITPKQSVSMMRPLIAHASVEKGFGGDSISHFGNKQWV